jgi:hypothetical protein
MRTFGKQPLWETIEITGKILIAAKVADTQQSRITLSFQLFPNSKREFQENVSQ